MAATLPVIDEEPLPPLYAGWLKAALQGPIPREKKATCSECPMVDATDELSDNVRFSSLTKCCTFVPHIPNYLVGAVLMAQEETARGYDSIVDRIAMSVGVTPLGLNRPPVFDLIYRAGGNKLFGRSPTMRCPHYVDEAGGRCGIWKQRNAVCTTWFCRHLRGQTGLSFWNAILRLLSQVEQELSVWCCLKMGVEPHLLCHALEDPRRDKDDILAEELVSKSPQSHAALWGDWAGREQDFYVGCARLVEPLEWGDVVSLCGPELRARLGALQLAHRAVQSQDLPARLKLSPTRIEQLDGERVRVVGYRPYDALILTRAVWLELFHFNGADTTSVLAALSPTVSAALMNDGLLQRLVDYRVLTVMEGEPPSVPVSLSQSPPSDHQQPSNTQF